MGQYFPRQPPECKTASEPFFQCLTKEGQGEEPHAAIKKCKNEMDVYDTCMKVYIYMYIIYKYII